MAAEQLEMCFGVIDGGKPSPYVNYRSKIDALDRNSKSAEEDSGSNNTRTEQRLLAVDGVGVSGRVPADAIDGTSS